MRFSIVFLFIFVVGCLFGQDNNASIQYIQSISQLRSDIIENHKIDLAELEHIYGFVDSMDCPELKEILIPSNSELTIKKFFIPDLSVSCFFGFAEKYPYYSNINSIFYDNFAMMELIRMGILEPRYPFKITKSNSFIEEISHYNIANTDNIAEIGAGEGVFSIILHKITQPKHLYINEIDSISLIDWRENMASFDVKDTTNISVVIGSEAQTNIAENQLDKIMIRRTYHHFSKYKKMLLSMYNNLKDDGELFILESSKLECSKAISKAKIKKQVSKNGFRLVSDTKIYDYYILKFAKVPHFHFD